MKKWLFSLCAVASLSAMADTMPQIVQQQAKKEVQRLNQLDRSTQGYKYHLLQKQIVNVDLNGDNLPDAAALLTFCEKTNCHNTTASHILIVALGNGKNQFVFKDKIMLQHQTDTIELKVKNRVLTVDGLVYGADDPHCCASQPYVQKYRWQNNQLKLIR